MYNCMIVLLEVSFIHFTTMDNHIVVYLIYIFISSYSCLDYIFISSYSCLDYILISSYSCLDYIFITSYSCLDYIFISSYSCLDYIFISSYSCLDYILQLIIYLAHHYCRVFLCMCSHVISYATRVLKSLLTFFTFIQLFPTVGCQMGF